MKRFSAIVVLITVFASGAEPESSELYAGRILGFSLASLHDKTTNLVVSCHVQIENLRDTELSVFYRKFEGGTSISYKNPHTGDPYGKGLGCLFPKRIVRYCGTAIIQDELGTHPPKRILTPKVKLPDIKIPPHDSKVLKFRLSVSELSSSLIESGLMESGNPNHDAVSRFFIHISLPDERMDLDLSAYREQWTVKTNAARHVFIAVDKDFTLDASVDGECDFIKGDFWGD